MATGPTLELNPDHWQVLAITETIALVQHRTTGNLGTFELSWRDTANFPPGFEQEAWAYFMERMHGK